MKIWSSQLRWLHGGRARFVSRVTNRENKKFEFDFAGRDPHNPLTFVSCSPPFDAEKR